MSATSPQPPLHSHQELDPIFLIDKLHIHLVGHEPKTLLSTLILQWEAPFELELIGLSRIGQYIVMIFEERKKQRTC